MKCNMYILFLFGLGAFINDGNAVIVCNKAFSSPPDADCSTESLPSGIGEIPCFVYGVNDSIVQLEEPDDNTMTWYRTCHTNATNPTCQATQKGPHNKAIPVISAGPNATQQILYSPNYNKGRNYRKSSICRYDVTCDPGHILGYIFNEHILENSTDICGVQNKCVDYVRLTYPNVTDEEWLCGLDAELNQTVVVDGHSNIHVEFYANRLEEAKGFNLAVLCYEPGFEPSKRKRQTEEEQARGSGRECVKVSDQKSDPVNSATELRVAIESEYVAEDLETNRVKCEYIIHELETLHYRNQQLRIRRRNGRMDRVSVARDINIQTLYVSSRFRKSRTFEGSADTRFRGYAELCLSRSGTRAYLLQLGLNPISKPTRDENDVIVQLQRSIGSALECNNFNDLYDEEDAAEEGVAYVPSVCECNFKRDQELDEKAILYGNACNDILRHVACSYQAAIMNRDCVTGRPVEDSAPLSADDCRNTQPADAVPTKPPTKPTDPPSTTTKPTTKVPTKLATSRPSDTTESTERHTTPVTSAPTHDTNRN